MSRMSARLCVTGAVCVMVMGAALCPGAMAIAAAPLAPMESGDSETQRAYGQLASARQAYERSMDRVRRDVRSQIESLKRAARRMKGDNTAAVDTALKAESDFAREGRVPDGDASKEILEDYATAADKLRRVFNDARLTVPSLAEEANAAMGHWDLVPWTAASVSGRNGGTLADGQPIRVAIGQADSAYRLEVLAKRSGDAGRLAIEIPFGEGKALEVPATVGTGGDVWVLLTVADSRVWADLGVARPIDLSKLKSADGDGVRIRAEGGEFSVSSVRFKPVVAGSPPRPDATATPNSNGSSGSNGGGGGTGGARSVSQLPVGVELTGEATIHGRAGKLPLEGNVVSIEEKTVTVRTKRHNAPGFIVWYFSRDGTKLKLESMEAQGGEFNYRVIRGSGSFDDKHISWTGETERLRGKKRVDIGTATHVLRVKEN